MGEVISSGNMLRGYVSARTDEQVAGCCKLESQPGQKVPDWLKGQFLRTGPALFDVEMYKMRHWFDGMAMLYRFHFERGEVFYNSRFLQSKAYTKAVADGELAYREFATVPHTTFLQFLFELFFPKYSDNANISVAKLAGGFAALNEAPTPQLFDPGTLQTTGPLNYTDKIKATTTTPHPHYDFDNRRVISFTTHFSIQNQYNIYSLPDGSTTRQLLASISTKQPSYMHSFAMTENYVILAQFPLVLGSFAKMLKNYKLPVIKDFEWKPELGTRFLVVSKKDGRVVHTAQTNAFNAWHHVNAFERGNEICLDICAYDVAELGDELYFNRLMRLEVTTIPRPFFRRYHIRLNSSIASCEEYPGQHFDLPRINYRQHNGKDYRYAYGNGYRRGSPHDMTNQLVKLDVTNNNSLQWWEENSYPGEPLFVPHPEAKSEDEGVVLSVVFNGNEFYSYLLILDGITFTEVARLKMPHIAPFAFHGLFTVDNELV